MLAVPRAAEAEAVFRCRPDAVLACSGALETGRDPGSDHRPAAVWLALPHPDDPAMEVELDRADLAGTAGIAAPVAALRRDVEHLGAKLAVREAQAGLPAGRHGVLAILDGPAAILSLSGAAAASLPRLRGLLLDEDRLAAHRPGEAGSTTARGVTVLAARALGVTAWLRPAGWDGDTPQRAQRDGFAGVLAPGPAEVEATRLHRDRAAAQARVGRGMENLVSGVATK